MILNVSAYCDLISFEFFADRALGSSRGQCRFCRLSFNFMLIAEVRHEISERPRWRPVRIVASICRMLENC